MMMAKLFNKRFYLAGIITKIMTLSLTDDLYSSRGNDFLNPEYGLKTVNMGLKLEHGYVDSRRLKHKHFRWRSK